MAATNQDYILIPLMLLVGGANVHLQDIDGHTALTKAEERGNDSLVQLLRSYHRRSQR